MYIFGFSINILSLLAIVLATGLVVDDGIVVTENIFKKLEAGMPRLQAAREGSDEIFFAVVATSITLAFVFLPIIFLQGLVGRLFREFGIVVAGAVLISAFVSLTLTPVLNVLLSRKTLRRSRFYNQTEPFFRGMENGYKQSLTRFMRHRWLAIVIVAACLGISAWIYKHLPTELAPLEDRSEFRLTVTAPEGTSFDYMDQYMNRLIQFIIDSVPEHHIILSVTSPGFGGSSGANRGFMYVTLVPPADRTRSQQDIVNYVNAHMRDFNEGSAYAVQTQTIQVGHRGGLPVSFVLQNLDFDKLKKYCPVSWMK